MSVMEAATTPTATETSAEPAEGASEAPAGSERSSADANNHPTEASDERDESGRYLSREAASYRRRLRDAESERDQLRAQLDQLQTTEAERLAAAAGLSAPGDLWAFGATLDTLRDENNAIDADAVSGLVSEIVKDRPGLQARPQGDLGIGRGAGAAGTTTEPKVGLSQLLKPERR
jgi:hypothetical protein